MTGFAALSGEISGGAATFSAQWDMRAVNGRGLDLRFRLPEGLDGLEAELRKRIAARIARGNVSVALKLVRTDPAGAMRLNTQALDNVLDMLAQAEKQAEAKGFALAPMTPADLLGLRGVIDTGPEGSDPAPLIAALLAQIDPLIEAFDIARQREGAAMLAVLSGQVAQIEALEQAARLAATARRGDQGEALRAALARLTDAAPNIEPGRLESGAPVGRKLDFLMQEFNREANTLCSKAQHAELTRIGLDLKTVIDQMREQVQNLE